jgi:hypothetical protein
MAVTEDGATVPNDNTTAFDAGDVLEGDDVVVTITNNGTGDLTISSIVDDGSGDFGITTNPWNGTDDLIITPGNSEDILLTPAAGDATSALVTIGSDDPTNPTYEFYLTVNVIPLLFSESFEGDGTWGGLDSGHTWTQVQEDTGSDASGIDWSLSTSNVYEGSYCAYLTWLSSDGDITKLVTPAIDFSGQATDVDMKFWLRQNDWSGAFDYLKVYYTTTDPAAGPWIELADYSGSEIDPYAEQTVTLLNSAGETTYHIAFEGFVDGNYGVQVDKITISE